MPRSRSLVSFALTFLGACHSPVAQPPGTPVPGTPVPGTPVPGTPVPAAPLPAGQSPSISAARPTELAFIRDFNPPRAAPGSQATPEARWGAPGLGGLSGLYYDAGEGTLYAISDDADPPARIYTFHVELSQSEFRVAPRSVLLLHEALPTGQLIRFDGESITGDAAGGLFIGTENHDDEPSRRWPSILRVRRDGLVTGSVTLPEAFLPEREGEPTRGPRSNRAFEGVSVSPSGRWLTAITEEALRQDGPLATFEQGSTVRLLRWDLQTPGEPSEFRYRTEPVPASPFENTKSWNNGVSELLSIDDERFLVLERAYIAPAGKHGKNTIRIFETTLPSRPGASQEAKSAGAPPLLSKRLVLDLDDIVPQLQPALQSLDNLEGMTFGPRLPSGERTLLLVSDDNFSEQQRTVFLAFRVLDGPPSEPRGRQ